MDALTQTEEGLTLLAIAANAFKPDQKAEKSRLPAVDLEREDRVARDKAKKAIRVTEQEIAELAAMGDPSHASNKSDEDDDSDDEEQTDEALLQELAEQLPDAAQKFKKDVELVRGLRDKTGATTGLSEEDLDAMHDVLTAAIKLIGKLQ